MSVKTPPIKDLLEVTEDKENRLTFMKNVSIPLKDSPLPIRANVYLPLTSEKTGRYPVLVTYGPYGKDIPYAKFYPKSFSEVNPEQKSKYSAWETPDPVYWTSQGYAIIRADERGLGQSPGFLDTMSRGTSECFFDVVEWAAEQPWSNGKVGLLGISYYAGMCLLSRRQSSPVTYTCHRLSVASCGSPPQRSRSHHPVGGYV